jgi:hypothetical protein
MKSTTTITLDQSDYNLIAAKVAEAWKKVESGITEGTRVQAEFQLFKLNFIIEVDYEMTTGNDFATEDTPVWNESEIDYCDTIDFHAFDMEGNELELEYNSEELNQTIKTYSI